MSWTVKRKRERPIWASKLNTYRGIFVKGSALKASDYGFSHCNVTKRGQATCNPYTRLSIHPVCTSVRSTYFQYRKVCHIFSTCSCTLQQPPKILNSSQNMFKLDLKSQALDDLADDWLMTKYCVFLLSTHPLLFSGSLRQKALVHRPPW